VTFQTAAYAVDGNSESGNFLRLMLQSATLGSQGIVNFLDCLVTATSPGTGAGLTISSGAVVVLGNETAFQGSYYGYNVGSDTSLSIAATGGSSRSDMVVVRAEDPTWGGSPWGNPASGQILFPRVISNVSAGSTQPPGGSGSCIPLARIDMPASTSVVQSSYIHDLRQVCNPQRIMQEFAVAGPGTATSWTVSTTAHAWPPGASWQVFIPSWATTAVMIWSINNMLYTGGGTAWARGFLYPVFGSSVSSPNLAFAQTLTSLRSTDEPPPFYHSTSGGAQASIGPSLRNTTQTLQFAQTTDGFQTGINQANETTQVTAILEFQGLASNI
jgi:hypothetical protein